MNNSNGDILGKIKGFFKEIYYFFSSKIFWIQFGKIAGLTVGGLLLVFWFMTCFTRHGSSVSVGNYVGKNMKQVLRDLDDDGFDFIVTDSIYLEDRPADIVLEQNPAPGSPVKSGRTIYLKITKAAGDMIVLPDIAGRDDINSYTDIMRSYGFKVGRVDTVPDPDLGDGTIKQVLIHGRDVTNQLQAGFKAPQGSLIDFVISRKESRPSVPNFVEEGFYNTVEQYIAKLQWRELNVATVIKDPSVTDENSAFVIKVMPRPGNELNKGDSVTIFITQKNPAAVKVDQFDQ
jgi:eukaryotic-like serine/threonine-protein kinase